MGDTSVRNGEEEQTEQQTSPTMDGSVICSNASINVAADTGVTYPTSSEVVSAGSIASEKIDVYSVSKPGDGDSMRYSTSASIGTSDTGNTNTIKTPALVSDCNEVLDTQPTQDAKIVDKQKNLKLLVPRPDTVASPGSRAVTRNQVALTQPFMNESLRVVVRVRLPIDHNDTGLSKHNGSLKFEQCLSVNQRENTVKVQDHVKNRTIQCQFDKVLPSTTTQSETYKILRGTVDAVLCGINCTVLAYGQTGSGKTHTMLGRGMEERLAASRTSKLLPSGSMGLERDWGIIPRILHDLFQSIENDLPDDSVAQVFVSYMQIYNDKVYDLLQDATMQVILPQIEISIWLKYIL